MRLYSVGGRWMRMKHWWNDTGWEKRRTRRITCRSAALSTTNLTWSGLGLNHSSAARGPHSTAWAVGRQSWAFIIGRWNVERWQRYRHEEDAYFVWADFRWKIIWCTQDFPLTVIHESSENYIIRLSCGVCVVWFRWYQSLGGSCCLHVGSSETFVHIYHCTQLQIP